MKRLFRRIFKALGVSSWYHVSAAYRMDSHVGSCVISLTCKVTPWLHEGNYKELVAFVESKADKPVSAPTITSITKLGY